MDKTLENIRWLEALLRDESKLKVFHNLKFDLLMLSFDGIDIFDERVMASTHCSLTMNKVLNSTSKQHDLKYLSVKYANRSTEEKDLPELWLKSNKRSFTREHGRPPTFADIPRQMVIDRAIWDTESTLYITHFLLPRVLDTCPQLYETERELMWVCVDMELYGVRVDITRAKSLRRRARRDLTRMLADMQRLVGTLQVTRKRKGVEVVEEIDEFNPNSVAHLEAAWRKLGIPLKFKTKAKRDKKTGEMKGGGNWSFDEYAMVRYVERPLASIIRDAGEESWKVAKLYRELRKAFRDHDLPQEQWLPPLVLKYRELSKMVSTYYDHIINDAVDIERGEDGREYGILHCKFNPAEAMTGRFSSSEPNLQNMPRLLGPRECFVPRPNTWNAHQDYSQVEMRMFVHFAKDEGMAAAIDSDIHQYIATKVYRKPREQITKEQRKRAKATGFGILYGSGADTQAETLTKRGLPTTKLEAQVIISAYHREFPSVRKVTSDFKADIEQKGYIENPFGRRYYIPVKFGYKSLNYMCQGTSADIIKAAMVRLWKWLRSVGSKARLIMTIHDEIVLEVPIDEAEYVLSHSLKIMEDRNSYFVPIIADSEIVTTRWSKKRDPEDLGLNLAA